MKACVAVPALLGLVALCDARAGPPARLTLGRGVRSASALELGAAPAAAPAAAEYKLPVPEVQHEKSPGKGYTKGSPLFKMQEEIEDLEKSVDGGKGEVLPVSVAMWEIMDLASQYTLVYMMLFVVNTVNKFFEQDKPLARLEKVLVGTVETVHFCPMLCVLFLGVRMRAVQLSQRETEKFGLPQWWVQWAMTGVTIAVHIQTLFAVVYSYATSRKFEVHEQAQASLQSKSSSLAMGFLIGRYIIMLCIYVGFTVICVGLIIMEAPEEVWGEDGGPTVSPTMRCVMALCLLFFGVYLAHTVAHTMNELRAQPMRFGYGINTLQFATETVQFAPMLCVLMLAVRMRALQINPYNGNPQGWAQWMFYLCTLTIFCQTLLVLLSYFLDAPSKKDDFGEVCYTAPHDMGEKKTAGKVLEAVRLVSMILMFCGVIAVMVSVYTIEHPDGQDKTPDVSPTMKCVLFCTIYYFGVHIFLWITLTIRKYTNNCMELADFLWGPARDSVAFCPILCILFIGLRMRALQITNNKGAPQWWAQWFMAAASWSCLFQALARVDVLLDRFMQRPLPNSARVLCVVLQYIGLTVMYVSGIGICIALFLITPETADGEGSAIPPPPVGGF